MTRTDKMVILYSHILFKSEHHFGRTNYPLKCQPIQGVGEDAFLKLFFLPMHACRRRFSATRLIDSFDLLVWIDTPKAALFDPSIETIAHQSAPLSGTAFDRAEHSRFKHRAQRTNGVRCLVQWHEIWLSFRPCDISGALAGQQRVIHPAFGTIAIADSSPVLKLGRDLHRQRGAGINP